MTTADQDQARACATCGMAVDVACNPLDAADVRALCYNCAEDEVRERPRSHTQACATCGNAARFTYAYPIVEDSSVLYDGGPVCSLACGLKLRQRQSAAKAKGEARGDE